MAMTKNLIGYLLTGLLISYWCISFSARRARSSLYAGGLTPRQSYPLRSRSSEEFMTVNSSPPDDRKKSHTSTQSTTIDTPPKSPPHYGNSLTVDPPELSEAISVYQDQPEINRGQTIVHRESDEFEIDDIDHVINSIKDDEGPERAGMINGNLRQTSTQGRPVSPVRPGTPVKKAPKSSVRFVKPTLTVTLNSENGSYVNDALEEDEKEEENPQDELNRPRNKTSQNGNKYSRRRKIRNAGISSINEQQSQNT